MALPKIATWRQPSSSARSRPRSLGTSTGRSPRVSPSSSKRVHQVGGVGQLGHPLRVHEAGRLDDRAARPRAAGWTNSALASTGTSPSRSAGRRADRPRRSVDAVGQRAQPSSRPPPPRRAAAPAPPARRPWHRPRSTVPAKGALSASSIFIASSTPSRCPSATASPSATSTASTVPGIGAVRLPSPAAAAVRGERRRAARRRSAGPGGPPRRVRGRRSTTACTRRPSTSRRTTCCSAENSRDRDVVDAAAGPVDAGTTAVELDPHRCRFGAEPEAVGPERSAGRRARAASIAGTQAAIVRARSSSGARHLGGGPARPCRWWRRGTPRTPRAPAGTRRWW